MRRQLCFILEPKWFKLTTCDWIRRILNETTLNSKYRSEALVLKYRDSFVCIVSYTRFRKVRFDTAVRSPSKRSKSA